jgi:type III secretion protein V
MPVPIKGFIEGLSKGNFSELLNRYSDLLLAGGLVGVVMMLIIPLPTFLMDILLVINISIGVILLLTSIYIPDPLSISSFPTILLFCTLFRLSLNVSTTRLILSQADAGSVVAAFGNFVVRGNYVVGGIMFIILTLINFIVIAKGSERVAEVAARFTLDAMPGKQMSIDADMRAGTIDMQEAIGRRKKLERESQLYGAMDGAMKFVKGDSIAGIIITAINIVGGLIIGGFINKMPMGEAAQTYALLTIGDGLVSQIPALITSTSAGFIVTRVASSEDADTNLGKDIGQQILGQPKALLIASFILIGLGIIPGLPFLPFFLLAAALFAISFAVRKTKKVVEEKEEEKEEEIQQAIEAKGDIPLVIPSPIVLEVGGALTSLVDDKQDGGRFLNEMIPLLRHGLYYETGVNFPGIQVRGESLELPADAYMIKINEIPMAGGRITPGTFLVGESLEQLRLFNIDGVETHHPIDNSICTWISAEYQELAKQAGFRMWDPGEYMIIHLSSVLRDNAGEFVGMQETQIMLEQLKRTHPALVDEVIPRILSLFQITEVLQRLVQEDISIRDLKTIMQTVAQWGHVERDPLELTELVRSGLKRYVSNKYSDGQGTIVVYLLDPEIESIIKSSIQRTDRGNYLALEPEITQEILESIGREIANHPASAQQPVILTNAEIRRYVRKLVELEFKRLAVVSYQELVPELRIQPIARISLGAGGQAAA